jgi:phosphate:Na+ symporter
MAAEAPRQIANAHTLFNVGNAVLFIWFAPWIGRLAVKVAPRKTQKIPADYKARHLNAYYLQSPASALDQARLELENIGKRAARMVKQGLPTAIRGSRTELDLLKDLDQEVDALHGQILTFLSQLSVGNLGEKQGRSILRYISICNYIENLADIVEMDIVREGYERIEKNLTISSDTALRLEELYGRASSAVDTAVGLITNPDRERGQALVEDKDDFQRQAQETRTHLARRLGAEEPKRVVTFRLETNLIEYTTRIFILARRMAMTIMDLPADSGTSKPLKD